MPTHIVLKIMHRDSYPDLASLRSLFLLLFIPCGSIARQVIITQTGVSGMEQLEWKG